MAFIYKPHLSALTQSLVQKPFCQFRHPFSCKSNRSEKSFFEPRFVTVSQGVPGKRFPGGVYSSAILLQEIGALGIDSQRRNETSQSVFSVSFTEEQPVLPGTALHNPFYKPAGVPVCIYHFRVSIPEELWRHPAYARFHDAQNIEQTAGTGKRFRLL